MRFDEISEILKIIDSSACEEFVLETDTIKLVVRRRSRGGEPAAPELSSAPLGLDRSAPAGPAPQAKPAAARPARAEPASAASGTMVTAPMVGTFYRAPSPGAPPFVESGAQVKEGDALCLIEVMKLFTTIYAPCSGRVADVGADNGELVEYGQMLFVIEA
jgi:acetyl-CoA carboxylase biotin carboxyl carrier protein